MLQTVGPCGLRLLPPLPVLLLLASADREAGLPKATLSLDPPWVNVLQGDNVTLTCRGAPGPGSPATRWFHNGNFLETQAQSSYSLTANSSDSGNYTCHTAQTSLSDPVHLDVVSDWLLLQTPRLLFQEGEPIVLRCHSWKGWPLYKVTFFHNKTSRKFSHTDFIFSIPRANSSHSGKYHCTGFIRKSRHSSQAVSIAVRGPAVPSISPLFALWPQITFCLVMGLLFAVDTGLYFSMKRDLRRLMGDWTNGKVTWSKSPEDK
ncbi:low affinity immunoglobulin gamma Fc region receptor II-a-like [Rousettus aegyptiacus]|uniref:Fc of IgG receptor IIa n=1 Tax=Rousettus aegyptiacus TaxID=9407 RepID=A0A7J8BDB6_ROUAE|nr:low affinity immunoglobulin gamma Fc region receptor II-a-like [Rousettus aegyptiacus]KAF6396672.1 Fc fragment of IgG receptor IIa [Rousettus aegyptiacus]